MSIGKVLIQVCSLVFDPYWKCVPILSQKKIQRLLHCISTIPKDFRVGKKSFSVFPCDLIKPAGFPTWGILWPFCHQTFPSVRDDSSSTTFCVQQIPSTQTPGRHNRFHLCWRAKGCDSLPKESRFVVHLPLLQVVTSADENNKTAENNFQKYCHLILAFLFLKQGYVSSPVPNLEGLRKIRRRGNDDQECDGCRNQSGERTEESSDTTCCTPQQSCSC